MYQRLLIAILLGLLAFGPAVAQEAGSANTPISSQNRLTSSDTSIKRLKLKGVLISSSGRTALVNGRPVQEGDSIAGAEVLEIEQRGIRVLVGSREVTITVGSSVAVDPSATRTARNSGVRTRKSQDRQRLVAERSTAPRYQDEPRDVTLPQHTVEAGETLSGIAMHYQRDGVTLDQMMMALYESNPQAFSDNINVLHEGAVLRIPGANQLHRQAPVAAAAEVARHAARWEQAAQEHRQVAKATPVGQYGPVEHGETLSAIASSVLHDGVTLDQMMIALYASNPQAFSGNINVLYEGAILDIPAAHEPAQLTPDTATAEVVRQTRVWKTGTRPISEPNDSNFMASVDMPLD